MGKTLENDFGTKLEAAVARIQKCCPPEVHEPITRALAVAESVITALGVRNAKNIIESVMKPKKKKRKKKTGELVRCNNAYQDRCPDRWRKFGCTARKAHVKSKNCAAPYPCVCDGGFSCYCVPYEHPVKL